MGKSLRLLPILYNIYLSFFEWNLISPEKDFVAMQNFQTLFADSEFIEVIANSLIYMVVSVFFATGYLPVRTSAIEDSEMQKLYDEKPLFRVAVDQLSTAIPRPMAKSFPKVNSLLLDALTKCILEPTADAQVIMDAAVVEANKILSK